MDPKEPFKRSIALVSGKGGSGKTMVCAVIALVLDQLGHNVVIFDADTGTAGMTYYLGLKLVPNIRIGLANIASQSSQLSDLEFGKRALQRIDGLKNGKFFGIGDHRRLEREIPEEKLPPLLEDVVAILSKDSWLIVDCRGGIDRESVAVCQAVDDILLVVESDTTSFQATKHVVDVLSDKDLAHKVRGFFINKVFDDPTMIVRSGTSVFGSHFLAAIPFDLQATRAFLVGEIPSIESLFATHVWQGLEKVYPEQIERPLGRPWRFEEFREVGLTNLDSIRGGAMSAGSILLVAFIFFFRYFSRASPPVDSISLFMVVYLLLLGLLGSFETTRRYLGRLLSMYTKALNRILFKAEK